MSAITLQKFEQIPASTVRERTRPETPSTSEFALVRAAKGGDVSAFEALYRLHAGRIYSLCLRMVGNPSQAEDLAQDAFIRAWSKLGTFRTESAFGTWLHRLTVNHVLGVLRKRTEETIDELPESIQQAGSPGLAIDLDRAIRSLPTGARTVFVLHDVEGYKHREIAELAEIAIGTSKAQLHRARRLLATRLSSSRAAQQTGTTDNHSSKGVE